MCRDGGCGHFTDENGDEIQAGTPEYAAAKAKAEAAGKDGTKQERITVEQMFETYGGVMASTRARAKDKGFSDEVTKFIGEVQKVAFYAGTVAGSSSMIQNVNVGGIPALEALRISDEALSTVSPKSNARRSIASILDLIDKIRDGKPGDATIHQDENVTVIAI